MTGAESSSDDWRADVEITDREDLKHAIRNALIHAGVSFDELAKQAETGDYSSIRARLAWAAIGDLYSVDL